MPTQHIPVLLSEVMQVLQPQPGNLALDATLGGGGHAASLLHAIQPNGTLYGFEHDAAAVTQLQNSLGKQYGPDQFIVSQRNFVHIGEQCQQWGISGQVNTMLFDLGYSSDQFARGRGFSFRANNEPLDLRMDLSNQSTAANVLANVSSDDLTQLLTEYGELRNPQRLAEVIMQRRAQQPIQTVGDLRDCVYAAFHTTSSDVLAKVWQALRIAVNQELTILPAALTGALDSLSPGGRMAVITFHSLEDRLVKRLFAAWADEERVHLINKHVIRPTWSEQQRNPRSRSAKLRALQKN